MLSEKDKNTIIRLKSLDWTWKNIAEAVSAKPETCRKFFQKYKATVGLPPKIKVPRTLIQGRLAYRIKRMVQENPSISFRDIENELKKDAKPDEKVPCWTTIRVFLVKSGHKNVKLNKKT